MKPPDDRNDVDSIVVCTKEGSPILVAVDIDGRVWVHTANEPQFAEMMETLGFNKRDLPKVTTVNA